LWRRGQERFSEEIPEQQERFLMPGEAVSEPNIRSDLWFARQRSPAQKDPGSFRKGLTRTAPNRNK
jgi:hypothetical protein